MKKFLLILFFVFIVIPISAYNQNFERKYNDAKAKYEQGQYSSAKKVISDALKTLPNLSSEQREKGQQLLTLCNQKIANQNRLNLSIDKMRLSHAHQRDSVSIDAGKPQLLSASSSASWCVVEGIHDNFLFFYTQFNENKEPREAVITVRMGKGKSKNILLLQEARPETSKKIIVRTHPDRAKISVDGSESLVGTWEGTLSSGVHRIHVEKGDYAAKDTTITVVDDMRQNETVEYNISLVPRFSKLDITVKPEDGFSFNSKVVMKINGEIVTVSGYSYDDERDEVGKRTVYSDGTIPVSSGILTLQLFSEHFVPLEQEIRVSPGETYKSEIQMTPITGFLSLVDGGNAADAMTLIDGMEIGPLYKTNGIRVLEGSHLLSFKKEGFKSAKPEYAITIADGEISMETVSMQPYVSYVFNSSPVGAQVYIDGEFVGITPTEEIDLQERESGHVFDVMYKKEGYLPVHRGIVPDYSQKQASDSIALWEALPVSITADEENIVVSITNKEDPGINFYSKEPLPADLVLPLRNTPYNITAYRSNGRRAYKGKLKFDNPQKNNRNLRVWSRDFFQILSAEYSVVPFELPLQDFSRAHFARAGLLNFRAFTLNGLSSSAVRAVAFFDDNFKRAYPAISFVLINGDFRMGGGLGDWVDANLLLSYAWYPPIWNVGNIKDSFKFNHMAGHDLFIGAEVSVRLRYFVPTFKIGYQMFPGMKLYTASDREYIISDFPIKNHFIVSFVVAFSAGRHSKGNNILHIW